MVHSKTIVKRVADVMRSGPRERLFRLFHKAMSIDPRYEQRGTSTVFRVRTPGSHPDVPSGSTM
jgi:hypothetical protein